MKKQLRERYGRIQNLDRAFDVTFWQAQSAQVRFDAMWELIVHASRVKGQDVRQLRLTDLLKLLDANRVRYLVIGGYAVFQYGEPRCTQNLSAR